MTLSLGVLGFHCMGLRLSDRCHIDGLLNIVGAIVGTRNGMLERTATTLRAEGRGERNTHSDDRRGNTHRRAVRLDQLPRLATDEVRFRNGVDDLSRR